MAKRKAPAQPVAKERKKGLSDAHQRNEQPQSKSPKGKSAESSSPTLEKKVELFASAMHKKGKELGSCNFTWENDPNDKGYKERMRQCIRAGLEAINAN